MLQELTIRNFALLDEVRLSFGGGMNVLTGETGAGKSIIIDAIGTVLGGRASADVIRTGAERAMVEAIFRVPPGAPGAGALRELLEEAGVADEDGGEDVILARELSRAGRNVARVNGRAVPVSTLSQVGGQLVDIHGQHEHLSLLRPGAQRDLLDHYGGLGERRAEVAALVRGLRAVRAEVRALQQDEREIARRIDLLSFQVEEIQAARLVPGEEESLVQERTRLANAARLAELAASVHEALAGGAADVPGALDLLGTAARSLALLTRIDDAMRPHEDLLTEATAQVEELVRTVVAYQDSIEFAPERLDQVNERLEVIHNLQRKYGATVAEVLAFGERVAAELEALVNREARAAGLEQEAARLEGEIGAAAGALSAARAQAGERLAAVVAEEMRSLSLRGAFQVALTREDDPDGVPVDGRRVRFDEAGADTVEFQFAPNPGEPPKSVARTASGGELSRILLALKAVLSAADRTPTLIFDEVDAGIGGRNGQVVGEKLAGLGEHHQVLCVTHLPQIAAYGDTHFFIAKQVNDGRTATTVRALDGDEAVEELAQMLGGVSPVTLQQARDLRARAQAWHEQRQRAARDNGRPHPDAASAGPATPAEGLRRGKAGSRTRPGSRRTVGEVQQTLQGAE